MGQDETWFLSRKLQPNDTKNEVIYLKKPTFLEVPLLYDSPHSGRNYPADFGSALPLEMLRRGEDAYVDELISTASAQGVTTLGALFPRSYLDVNRRIDDLDPEMVVDWPELQLGVKSRLGIGLIRKIIIPGQLIYDRKLTKDEILWRQSKYYEPYWNKLREELSRLVQRWGRVWWVNWHSMKSMGNEATPDGAKPRADVVISDLDGNSSSIEFLQLVKRFILEKGLSVSVNDPYKGGTLLKELAKPSANIHGLQIELNRALYLDEAKVCKTNNFPALQQIIQQLTLKICDYLEATK